MASKTGTVKLHRVLRAPVARVYKAFTNKSALEYWLSPYGFTGAIDEFEVKVGKGYHMSFTNFTTDNRHSFSVKYLELEPNKLIRHSDSFDGDELKGEMMVTINFKEVACGTELHITQEGIPEAIPTEFCYLGWQESLAQLANLVEPEITDDC